ncbi:MAG: fumarylacetoacetate hydrolase family protein [Tagaea sp.]|nr:fumarylacetoacetate hydrolase family protein [Tagaea sp.]
MKLATFEAAGQARIGLVHADETRIFDLAAAAARAGRHAPFDSMLELIDADEAGLDLARAIFAQRRAEEDLSRPLDAVRLLAPLPEPRQMRDCMTFPLHIRQGPRGMARLRALAAGDAAEAARIGAEPLPDLPSVFGERPIYYITNRFNVAGPDTVLRWPAYSGVMDYELEFGIVTRKRGRDIPLANAAAHIFGYTIFNDFSARDVQAVESLGRLGPSKSKSFDGGSVLGPWIVTPDEIGDERDLTLVASIDGVEVSRGSSGDMLFSFAEILAFVSRDETVMPGEFVGSGTVGNGCGLEHGRFLRDGETVELRVSRIGALRTTVRAGRGG